DVAVNGSRVRIEQQLRPIAPEPPFRLPRAGHAEPVTLAGTEAGDIPMPAEGRRLGKREARLRAILVEQTQVDALRDFGKDGEVDALPVVGGSERKGLAWPDVVGRARRSGQARQHGAHIEAKTMPPASAEDR